MVGLLSWGVGWWWWGFKIIHHSVENALVTGCHHHQTDPQNLREEKRKTEWFSPGLGRHGNNDRPSNVSARQAFPRKVALQVGGLEGGTVIKVKARADESAERFCSTSGCLRGQGSGGSCRNTHGGKKTNKKKHTRSPDARRDADAVKPSFAF